MKKIIDRLAIVIVCVALFGAAYSATINLIAAAGDVENDSVDSGMPVKTGGVARTSATNWSAVADGDRVNSSFDKMGRRLTARCPREQRFHNNITLVDATETEIIAAGGAGIFRDLSFMTFSNTSATNVRVDVCDDSCASDVVFSIFLGANGGGAIWEPPDPLPLDVANTNWTVQLSGVADGVRIFAMACEDE